MDKVTCEEVDISSENTEIIGYISYMTFKKTTVIQRPKKKTIKDCVIQTGIYKGISQFC